MSYRTAKVLHEVSADIRFYHGQLGLSLTFLPHQFPVHSYEPYAIDVRGRILVSTRPTCYVSFQYQLYSNMDEACARHPRVMWQMLDHQSTAHT